ILRAAGEYEAAGDGLLVVVVREGEELLRLHVFEGIREDHLAREVEMLDGHVARRRREVAEGTADVASGERGAGGGCVQDTAESRCRQQHRGENQGQRACHGCSLSQRASSASV